MLIVDYSQLIVSSYMVVGYGSVTSDNDVDLDLVRHIALDGIRIINSKFRRRYGNPVLAVDCTNRKSWRKEEFPYYKANRVDIRKKSKINWPELFRSMESVKQELIEFFPYKVIEVDGAEADDIIGVLTRHAVKQGEEVMIVSGDKDFIQLQIDNSLVTQWDKVQDKFIGAADPKRYMFEHVLAGDRGDGIPNFLSPDDSFVNKIRQTPLTQKKKDELWENPYVLRQDERFLRNLKLIDLKFTPKQIQSDILEKFNNYNVNDKSRLHSYFIEKRMKKLYQYIGDF